MGGETKCMAHTGCMYLSVTEIRSQETAGSSRDRLLSGLSVI